MAPALRIRLILLMTLPALLVPRGLVLGWCLCAGEDSTGCCAAPEEVSTAPSGCCAGEQEDDPTPRVESRGDLDCPGCRSIEVKHFEEFLVGASAPEVPAPALTSAFVQVVERELQASRDLHARLRAPPGVVRSPGLLPGVLPLRI